MVSPSRAMSIIMPPFGGHVHIECHNHSYHRPPPSPLRGPLPLKGTQEALLDLPFCIIRYDWNSADWLASLATPYPGCAGLPPKGETTHYDLCVAGAPSNHVRCASTGKRITRFSGRFAPLRIVFPCHPCSGGGRIKHLEAFLS